MAFEQHAVPQNIASYHFRLVGDMTLKQFFELASGAIVGLLIYAAPFPAIIRWPLIVVSILFGAALAFLPIQDRPLEQWVASFIQAVYAPTVFVWNKNHPTNYYKDNAAAPQTTAQTQTIPTEAGIVKPTTNPEATLDQTEEARLARIHEAMKNPHVDGATLIKSPPRVVEANVPRSDLTVNTQQSQQLKPSQDSLLHKTDILVPTMGAVQVEPKGFAQGGTAPKQQITTTANLAQPFATQNKPIDAKGAQFSQAASPPANPHNPNTVVGQVTDNAGKIVQNAILEVKDNAGRPVRALRSNAAGHFYIVTPLLNGEYTMSTDKEGLEFDPVKFTAQGEVIPPIIIKPKN